MKRCIAVAMFGFLAFIGCGKAALTSSANANVSNDFPNLKSRVREKDLDKTVWFVNEKNLNLKEAYTLLIKYYSYDNNDKQTYELFYNGY